MSKEFIPYEQTLALKKLGFDEPCIYYIDKNNNHYIYNFQQHPDEFINWCGSNVIAAPTYSQAFRWFRQNHQLEGYIFMVDCLEKTYQYHIDFSDKEDKELYSFEHIPQCFVSLEYHSFYEDAELECLKKLIEIVKENN